MKSNNVKILNEFGIKPTFNYTAAGADFYIPYFNVDKREKAFKAFESSFKVSSIEIENIYNVIKHFMNTEDEKNLINIVHLFLAIDSVAINSYNNDLIAKVKLFVERYLVFDAKHKPGIKMELNDAVLINSGIRVALPIGTAGIFFNKSGKGNAGFDVRAQVVDEDYTGLVHCSVAFTKDTEADSCKIYCGDKLTQMVILPVYHIPYVEVDENEYYETMANSQRGSQSFGSSDEKH